MIFRGLLVGSVAILALVPTIENSVEGGKGAASIKIVMHKAHKSGLAGNFITGKASEDEKKQLIALYTDLTASKNPKGSDKDWTERTQALLRAVKTDDMKALRKALDCTGCHNEHKP